MRRNLLAVSVSIVMLASAGQVSHAEENATNSKGSCDELQMKVLEKIRDRDIPQALAHYRQMTSQLSAEDQKRIKKLRRQSRRTIRKISKLQRAGRSVYEKYDDLHTTLDKSKSPKDSKERKDLIQREETEHQPIVASIKKIIDSRNQVTRQAREIITASFTIEADKKRTLRPKIKRYGLAALNDSVGVDIEPAMLSAQSTRFPFIRFEKSISGNTGKLDAPVLLFQVEVGSRSIDLAQVWVATGQHGKAMSIEQFTRSNLPQYCSKQPSQLSQETFQTKISVYNRGLAANQNQD